jgi:hypothetical protein
VVEASLEQACQEGLLLPLVGRLLFFIGEVPHIVGVMLDLLDGDVADGVVGEDLRLVIGSALFACSLGDDFELALDVGRVHL